MFLILAIPMLATVAGPAVTPAEACDCEFCEMAGTIEGAGIIRECESEEAFAGENDEDGAVTWTECETSP